MLYEVITIRKASESLSYYNQVYLIFFKCYKQEAYVLDAMQRNDRITSYNVCYTKLLRMAMKTVLSTP